MKPKSNTINVSVYQKSLYKSVKRRTIYFTQKWDCLLISYLENMYCTLIKLCRRVKWFLMYKSKTMHSCCWSYQIYYLPLCNRVKSVLRLFKVSNKNLVVRHNIDQNFVYNILIKIRYHPRINVGWDILFKNVVLIMKVCVFFNI